MDRRGRHQMADVAHEQQAAAGQGEGGAVGRGIGAVTGKAPRHRPPALLEARLERALHQPEPIGRSEEHTSELQSLMRISYAVFCLKKKSLKHITSEQIVQ